MAQGWPPAATIDLPGLDTLAAYNDFSPVCDSTGRRIAFTTDRNGQHDVMVWDRDSASVLALPDLATPEERDAMYGLPVAEIKDSPGLNVDIAFITNFHTRFVLDAIARRLPERPKYMEPMDFNYVVWGNRPVKPFEKHFQLQRINCHPLESCKICSAVMA